MCRIHPMGRPLGRSQLPWEAATWALWGKLGQWLPKAGVGGLNRPFLGRTDLRTKRLEQAAAVGTVTIILHLLILPVFVIQEGLKIGGTDKFVLYMSQDGHLTSPTVPKAHGHQLLQKGTGSSHGHI